MALPAPEADIIIVGAGAAGCILAARLAAGDPALKILVLEGGPHTLDDPAVTTPGAFLNNLVPGAAPRTRFFTSEVSEEMLGRQTVVPVGGCVGGATAINFMMYTRGSASDYDDWEMEHQNPGWGFAGMLPMFEKFETYEVDEGAPRHGAAGPIHITMGGNQSDFSQQWLDTATAYDTSRPLVSDFNDFHTPNAFCKWPKYINNEGKRQDVAHRFLYPAVQAPGSNVTLRVLCKVNRVVFDGDRAVGVEYEDESADNAPATVVVTASKLVVLAAGALGSPMILEHSGIGSPEVLAAAGIDVRCALEGVGENYQDHNLMAAAYISASGVTGDRDAYLRGDPEHVAAATAQYQASGQGPFSTNGIDAGVKVRPTPKELQALGNAFGEEWSYFERAPDKIVIFEAISAGVLLPGGLPEGEYFSTLALTAYPFSRGSVHIRSANAADPPLFIPGFLSHPADVAPLMWQYKFAREIARRLPYYRGELAPTHPSFAPDSKAACSAPEIGPVAIDAEDILYTEEDDKVLETWVRQTVQTTWHSMGTCAMKPRDKGGVVNSKLNVYGVAGLKVADLSICPGNVGANTASTAMAIGEKAAVIIAEELGISGV